MERGEVWWADVPPPVGRRPVLLLSRNAVYATRRSVTVAPVTRTIRAIPTEVVLDERDGLPARSVVNLDDILTIPKDVVQEFITKLSPEKLGQVRQAIVFALDLGATS